MQNNDQAFQDALRFAQSPAGQQLLHILQQTGGTQLQDAMDKAAAGDYTQAKQALSTLLANPDVKKIFDQFGR